jgi:hypothetical protein
MRIWSALCGALSLCLLRAPVFAEAVPLINYQGRLVQGTNLFNGTVHATFRIYSAPSGGTLLCTSSNTATAVDGLYATFIGQRTSFGSIAAALQDSDPWLEVEVNGTTLAPREKIGGAAYANTAFQLSYLRVTTNSTSPNLAGGYTGNVAAAFGTSVGGGGFAGYANVASGAYSVVAGGSSNKVAGGGGHGAIGGGFANHVETSLSSIGGGSHNRAMDFGVAIPGGTSNRVQFGAMYSSIAGGLGNEVEVVAEYAHIAGGKDNLVASNADYAVVAGGRSNVAAASDAFAAGFHARALHARSFVWNNGATGTGSTNADSWTVSAPGGARFFSAAGVGVILQPGANAWSAMSDRNAKERVVPVDPRKVLERLARIPVATWNLKSQDPTIRHIGPMAQDFRAAFGVGEDDRSISTSDADGVAFAAIQGLYLQHLELVRRIRAMETDLRLLRATRDH